MTELFDEEEYTRWVNQAKHTLGSAERDKACGDYSWCCFKCHQAGEYAVKALLRGLGQSFSGHSILKLIAKLKQQGFALSREVEQQARSLDRHYVPTRYPNAYPTGSPFEFYDAKTAEEAIKAARCILELIQQQKAKLW
jgi:HEPN domain-containing protein